MSSRFVSGNICSHLERKLQELIMWVHWTGREGVEHAILKHAFSVLKISIFYTYFITPTIRKRFYGSYYHDY